MNNSNSKNSKIRITLAGAVVLVTAFAVGLSGNLFNDAQQRGLTSYTDSFESVQISDSETPLADQSVKTTKKSKTKTVKLKKKAKKTYTKRLKDKVSTKTTVKENGSNMVETKTTVKTETKEKYKKKSKKKKVTTTVTTTIITTTYAAKSTETELSSAEPEKNGSVNSGQQEAVKPAEEAQPEQQPEKIQQEEPTEETQPGQITEQPAAEPEGQPEEPAEETQPEQAEQQPEQAEQQPEQAEPGQPADTPSNETAPALPEGVSAIKTAAPKADNVLLEAFDKLGFEFSVDAKYQYTGMFDSRTRKIILRNNDDNVYHELGHFLAFASSNYDVSAAFEEVYKAEKSLYNGRNSSYVLKNSSEYFAESYRNYVLDEGKLKAERPLTYKAVETALGRITDSQIARLKRVYGAIWNQ